MGRKKALKPDTYFSSPGPEPEGDEEVPSKTVSSVDIGTSNFAAGRVTLVVTPGTEGKEWRVILRDACALTLKNGVPDASIEAIVETLFLKMNSPQLDWFWDDEGRREICVERQVDHIGSLASAKKNHPGRATMYAVYSALKMLEVSRRRPTFNFSDEHRRTFGIPDARMIAESQRADRFVPVSGHKKAGLRGLHGNDRKEKTGDICEEMLEQDGQYEALEWFNQLARHKPREDVADVYLQARRHLEDWHNRRLIDRRKRIRAENKKRRESEAERKRLQRKRKAPPDPSQSKKSAKARKTTTESNPSSDAVTHVTI